MIPSEKRKRTFIGLFNLFSAGLQTYLDIDRWRKPFQTLDMFKISDGQLRIAIGGSHMLLWRFFDVFTITRVESYRFLDLYGCWAGGQLKPTKPPKKKKKKQKKTQKIIQKECK
ncbi:hypothetical protein GJAV_G00049270 [Gymnothorax javanicus]|nr:hypothetical protein GJAV_G00049270 [Gymnothorax javanicus]